MKYNFTGTSDNTCIFQDVTCQVGRSYLRILSNIYRSNVRSVVFKNTKAEIKFQRYDSPNVACVTDLGATLFSLKMIMQIYLNLLFRSINIFDVTCCKFIFDLKMLCEF